MERSHTPYTEVRASMPDFRNFGILVRGVLLAEGIRFASAYVVAGGVVGAVESVASQGSFFDPVLLLVLLGLYLLGARLQRLAFYQGSAAVVFVAIMSTFLWWWGQSLLLPKEAMPDIVYSSTVAALICLPILGYFNWLSRVLSPSLSEARLMALQARIRPHFLFNSLNTVLGLMRAEPGKAEHVLENLAALCRVLLSETRELVPLSHELDLARAYIEIEVERLGARLTVNWQCQGAPLDALVPPLLLQPLLENSVYHGVEPSETGGVVNVTIFLKGDQLNLVVRNPCESPSLRRSGNRMALTNIRERLSLHFDAEAEMKVYEADGEFVVQIRLPYRRG